MEYIEACTVFDWLVKCKPSAGQRWRFIRELIYAFFWKSIFCLEHNDIHSKNVLAKIERPPWDTVLEPDIGWNAEPKIIDFGRVVLTKPRAQAQTKSSSKQANQCTNPCSPQTGLSPGNTFTSGTRIDEPWADSSGFEDTFELLFSENEDMKLSEYYQDVVKRVRRAIEAHRSAIGPKFWVSVFLAARINVTLFTNKLNPYKPESSYHGDWIQHACSLCLRLITSSDDYEPEEFARAMARQYEEQTGKPAEIL